MAKRRGDDEERSGDQVPRRPNSRPRSRDIADDETFDDRSDGTRDLADANGEEDRPRKRSRSRREDYEEDNRRDDDVDWIPPKKKKRVKLSKSERERIRRENEESRAEAENNAIIEWGPPIFMTFLGAVMILVSGMILARRTEGLINPMLMFGIVVAYTLVLIPVVIASLMVIGGVCAIDYGTIKNAIRSLVAITFLVNGIYAVGNLFPFGFFITPLVAGIVTFALFMTFFSLDPQETMTSLGILNVILWVANKFVFLMIVALLTRGGHRDRDFDPDQPDQRGKLADRFDRQPRDLDPDD